MRLEPANLRLEHLNFNKVSEFRLFMILILGRVSLLLSDYED